MYCMPASFSILLILFYVPLIYLLLFWSTAAGYPGCTYAWSHQCRHMGAALYHFCWCSSSNERMSRRASLNSKRNFSYLSLSLSLSSLVQALSFPSQLPVLLIKCFKQKRFLFTTSYTWVLPKHKSLSSLFPFSTHFCKIHHAISSTNPYKVLF